MIIAYDINGPKNVKREKNEFITHLQKSSQCVCASTVVGYAGNLLVQKMTLVVLYIRKGHVINLADDPIYRTVCDDNNLQ